MAINSEIFDIKQDHLVGKLILSPVSKGRILNIKTIDDSSVVTITASDLAEKIIKGTDSYAPILADDFITFLGQPVMAVFGPDIETVDVFCSHVELEIDTEFEPSVFSENKIQPFEWSSGEVSKYFTEEAKTVESTFKIASTTEHLCSNERIFANFVDGCCHLKLSSQWPLHARDCVAYALGLPKSKVLINLQSFRADFDQLLFYPAVCGVICAAAAKKTGSLVELTANALSSQPETEFKRTTVINDDGKPLAEKISVFSDFGAYPFYVEEAYNNLLAGLVPHYELNAVEVKIQINRSTKAPASFFGDLGYSSALAFTEQHYTKIPWLLNKSPYEWKSENLSRISIINEKVKKCLAFENLQQTLDECAVDSWYNRNHAIFSQEHFKNTHVSPLSGYSKGIGIACGQGIAGFSDKYPYGDPHSLSISISEDDRAFVSLGFYMPSDTREIYRGIISNYLGFEKDRILFLDLNSESIKDFGPNVLSRSIAIIPKLLISACQQISKRLEKGAKKPLVQQVVFRSDKDQAFFETNTFGSIVVTVHIDPVKIVPVIDSVTARLKFGKVYDTTILSRRIRQTISSTISQVCPCAISNYTLDLKVKSNPNLPGGSCTSMLRGITFAALSCSISQALHHELHSFPVYGEDILAILKMQKKKEEVVNEN